METKKLQDFRKVALSRTQSLLTDQGRILVGEILDASAEDASLKVASAFDGIDALRVGTNEFAAIKMEVRKNGSVVPNKYGYLILEEDANGNVSPIYLSEEEFNALS